MGMKLTDYFSRSFGILEAVGPLIALCHGLNIFVERFSNSERFFRWVDKGRHILLVRSGLLQYMSIGKKYFSIWVILIGLGEDYKSCMLHLPDENSCPIWAVYFNFKYWKHLPPRKSFQTLTSFPCLSKACSRKSPTLCSLPCFRQPFASFCLSYEETLWTRVKLRRDLFRRWCGHNTTGYRGGKLLWGGWRGPMVRKRTSSALGVGEVKVAVATEATLLLRPGGNLGIVWGPLTDTRNLPLCAQYPHCFVLSPLFFSWYVEFQTVPLWAGRWMLKFPGDSFVYTMNFVYHACSFLVADLSSCKTLLKKLNKILLWFVLQTVVHHTNVECVVYRQKTYGYMGKAYNIVNHTRTGGPSLVHHVSKSFA